MTVEARILNSKSLKRNSNKITISAVTTAGTRNSTTDNKNRKQFDGDAEPEIPQLDNKNSR